MSAEKATLYTVAGRVDADYVAAGIQDLGKLFAGGHAMFWTNPEDALAFGTSGPERSRLPVGFKITIEPITTEE